MIINNLNKLNSYNKILKRMNNNYNNNQIKYKYNLKNYKIMKYKLMNIFKRIKHNNKYIKKKQIV